ncbi:diacylglycerol kinase [Aeromicrobium sp.]|uniref:diacylglycerol kinase n=1 Tax=Aeromicrobium sp. TaxID=1871063 RepID=UPI0030BB473A
MHYALVVNPTSGKRRGVAVAAQAAERLGRAGHVTTRIQGEDAPSARDQLKQAIETGLDGVLVVGGDGALHGVLDHVADSDLAFGLIPAGTGNDTARSLGIPVKDTDAAVDLIVAGHVRTVDLARTDEAYVATVIASGFDSKVNERANDMTWPRGNMRYNIAILAELRKFEPLEFTLTLDGTTIEREAMLVAVGNGPSFGGGIRICEGASMDDGLLDVVVINPVSKAKLVRVFPKLYKGTHITMPEFERHRVREVTLSSPGIVAYGDGERLGALPMTTRIQPGALRVFAPLAAQPGDPSRRA